MKCTKSVMILKALSRQSHGADKTYLLHLFNCMVRMNCGSVTCESTSKTALKLLDPVPLLGLWLSPGAFQTGLLQGLRVKHHRTYADLVYAALHHPFSRAILGFVSRTFVPQSSISPYFPVHVNKKAEHVLVAFTHLLSPTSLLLGI